MTNFDDGDIHYRAVPATDFALLAGVSEALRSRDADARADILTAAVDAGAIGRFAALAGHATGDEVLALCLLARSFHRQVPLSLVIPWFDDADPAVRVAVVRTTALRTPDPSVTAMVARAVADSSADVRIAAIRAVGENGDAALRALLTPLAADPDPAVRRCYEAGASTR